VLLTRWAARRSRTRCCRPSSRTARRTRRIAKTRTTVRRQPCPAARCVAVLRAAVGSLAHSLFTRSISASLTLSLTRVIAYTPAQHVQPFQPVLPRRHGQLSRLPPPPPRRRGLGAARVRSHCRFRIRGTDYVREYGVKWMSGIVQSDNAAEP
jgi:hypothetical protein